MSGLALCICLLRNDPDGISGGGTQLCSLLLLGLLFLFNPKDLFYIFSSVVSLFLINIKWYGNFMSSYRADVITDFLKERPVPITRFYLEKTSVAESEPVVPFFQELELYLAISALASQLRSRTNEFKIVEFSAHFVSFLNSDHFISFSLYSTDITIPILFLSLLCTIFLL